MCRLRRGKKRHFGMGSRRPAQEVFGTKWLLSIFLHSEGFLSRPFGGLGIIYIIKIYYMYNIISCILNSHNMLVFQLHFPSWQKWKIVVRALFGRRGSWDRSPGAAFPHVGRRLLGDARLVLSTDSTNGDGFFLKSEEIWILRDDNLEQSPTIGTLYNIYIRTMSIYF